MYFNLSSILRPWAGGNPLMALQQQTQARSKPKTRALRAQ